MSNVTKSTPQDAPSQREVYLSQLQESLDDPIHKRLVAAYLTGTEPVASMEAELSSILNELMTDED